MILSQSLRRLVVDGVTNYWRNVGLTVATTFVMSLTLFLIGVVGLLNIIGIVALNTIKEKVDVSVYFSASASEVQIQETRIDIESMQEVASTDYITAQQALDLFKKKYENNPTIMQSIDELPQNPLQPTLIIRAKNPEDYEKITSILQAKKQSGVIDRVTFDDNRAVIERLDKGVNIIQNGGIALTVLFVLIALVVMFNTIRLTIFSRQKEITIMRLVGATAWYIRMPFIIEGLMYGIFASILAFAALFPLLRFIGPKLEDFFQIEAGTALLQFFLSHALINLGMLLVVGLVIGTISSIIAIRRHLKV
jgi:cell division transport system permease protein